MRTLNPIPFLAALVLAVGHFLAPPAAQAQRPGSVDLSWNPHFESSSTYAPISGVMLQQDDGKLIVGGLFDSVNGVPAGAIVRLNVDGSTDTTFNTGGSGFYKSDTTFPPVAVISKILLVENGKMLVAGHFEYYNGQPGIGLIRLNPDGSRDDTFDTGSGPEFWYADGTMANYYNWSALSSSMQSLPNGQILFSGYLSGWSGHPTAIVRLNADGSVDESFQITIDGPNAFIIAKVHKATPPPILSFIADPGIESVNGVNIQPSQRATPTGPQLNLYRIDEDGTVDTSFFKPLPGPNVSHSSISDSVTTGMRMYSGNFTEWDGEERLHVAFLNADQSLNPRTLPLPEIFGVPEAIIKLYPFDEDNLAGPFVLTGYFSIVDGVPRNSLALLNADGSLDLSFDPGDGPRDEAGELATLSIRYWDRKNGAVIVEGKFVTFDGVPRNRRARIYLETPSPVKIDGLVRSAGGVVTLNFTKTTDASMILQSTDDLGATPVVWTIVDRNDDVAGNYQLEDPDTANISRRVYRFKVE